jgi:diacylglycerol kinase
VWLAVVEFEGRKENLAQQNNLFSASAFHTAWEDKANLRTEGNPLLLLTVWKFFLSNIRVQLCFILLSLKIIS